MGSPCQHYKKDYQGETERVKLLQKHMDVRNLISKCQYSNKILSRDDIIDTAVLSLTGLRSLENGKTFVPDSEKTDSTGLKMRLLVAE
jgi:predicted RNase H-like nuclease